MTSTPRHAAVLGGNRIPFAREGGAYAEASNQDMLTATLDGLVARFGLRGERLGAVAGGAVLKHARDFNLTREAVLGSTLDHATPAHDVQMACDTGLQATLAVANKIALGQVDSAIAGGVDTTSDAPIAVNEDLREILMEANRGKSLAERAKLIPRLRPHHLLPAIPRNEEPRTGYSMGEHQAITAKQWGITREEQDELTVRSHRNLAAAYDRGFFDDLVTPYLGLTRDENLRPDTSVEKLARLKPVFGQGPDATMTAGNSTPLTDGASAVLVGDREEAEADGFEPRARFVARVAVGEDPVMQLTGVIPATRLVLKKAGLSIDDMDWIEINEAFATVVLSWADELKPDMEKVNPWGGAIAHGHPLGATGAGLMAKMLAGLEATDGQFGLQVMCIGHGMSTATILERI